MPRMRVCPQCKEGFQLALTGRPPTYCSSTCRKTAWEDRRLQEAVNAAVEAERQRANRGNETPAAAGNRGNETEAEPLPVEGDECPYCRDVVADLVPHLRVCLERPDGSVD